MKKILLVLLFPAVMFAQNQHLAAIDMDYLNYTKEMIRDNYRGYENFKLVKDEKGLLVYEGGECFLNWQIKITKYYFDSTDSLYKINVILDDSLDEDGKIYSQVIKKFREWFGNENEYKESNDIEYYYWHFTIQEFDFHNMMYVSKAKDRKSNTIITQADYNRMNEVDNGK